MRAWRQGSIIPQQPLPGLLLRSKAERFALGPISPPYPHPLRRFWQQPSKSCLDALNSVRTPRPLGTIMEEKTAYILVGSFVGFVIERYGLASFRSLYETGNYEQVYGKALGTLDKEWRANLQEN
jgi:hypothetical protein